VGQGDGLDLILFEDVSQLVVSSEFMRGEASTVNGGADLARLLRGYVLRFGGAIPPCTVMERNFSGLSKPSWERKVKGV